MKICIQPYTADAAASVREFNERLRAHGMARFSLPQQPGPALLWSRRAEPCRQERFVATEDGVVRGGYTLYHQALSIRGDMIDTANFIWPVSEGVIDKNYSLVGIQLLLDALRRQPLLFGLGMAGSDGPLTKLVKAVGWDVSVVPFYFKVLNGARFLRNLPIHGKHRGAATLLDVAASCGLGRVASGLCNRAWLGANPNTPRAEPVDWFSRWADACWNLVSSHYSVLSLRDSAVLNALYANRPDFACLKIRAADRDLGWVVVERSLWNPERFGEMKVASLLDCLALPADAAAVTQAATHWLESHGLDLIVSNQSHPDWRAALRRSGFLRGPSTFLFASSPQLTRLLREADPLRREMHFTRGSGDVPLHQESQTMPAQSRDTVVAQL